MLYEGIMKIRNMLQNISLAKAGHLFEHGKLMHDVQHKDLQVRLRRTITFQTEDENIEMQFKSFQSRHRELNRMT